MAEADTDFLQGGKAIVKPPGFCNSAFGGGEGREITRPA